MDKTDAEGQQPLRLAALEGLADIEIATTSGQVVARRARKSAVDLLDGEVSKFISLDQLAQNLKLGPLRSMIVDSKSTKAVVARANAPTADGFMMNHAEQAKAESVLVAAAAETVANSLTAIEVVKQVIQ